MKSLWTCAFGILALGLSAMPVQAGEPATIILTGGCQSGGCGNGGCGNGGCGHKSISAASCCEDDGCKPSCWQKLKDLCKKKDRCEPACENKCDECDECKPSLCDRIKACFKKKDCCEPEPVACDPCGEKKKKFSFSFKKKKNDCCDDCGTVHAAPIAAPAIQAEPKAEPEKIGLPMPK
jgi:hypothetical protein